MYKRNASKDQRPYSIISTIRVPEIYIASTVPYLMLWVLKEKMLIFGWSPLYFLTPLLIASLTSVAWMGESLKLFTGIEDFDR